MGARPLRHEGAVGRRSWILSALQALGFLSVAELTRELGVSHMTVRRDLHRLESEGHVRLVHGGVRLAPRALGQARFPAGVRAAARARTAQLAAAMVGEQDVVIIDAGAAALELARALPEGFRGSVITHSVPVLTVLAEEPGGPSVVALGGELLSDRGAVVGPTTEAALARLRARVFFVSPAAVDARGMYACSPAEARVQQGLMDIADDVVLVATHEAFARSAPVLVGPLNRLRAVVTDRTPPASITEALAAAGVRIQVADE